MEEEKKLCTLKVDYGSTRGNNTIQNRFNKIFLGRKQ